MSNKYRLYEMFITWYCIKIHNFCIRDLNTLFNKLKKETEFSVNSVSVYLNTLNYIKKCCVLIGKRLCSWWHYLWAFQYLDTSLWLLFIWVGFFLYFFNKPTKTLHWLFKFGLLMHEQPGHDKYLTNSSHYLIDTTINGVVLSNMS